jgi:hypothetical protein
MAALFPGLSPIYIDPQGGHTNRPPPGNDAGWALVSRPTQVQPVNAHGAQTVTVKAVGVTRQTLFPPHDIPEPLLEEPKKEENKKHSLFGKKSGD